MDSIRRGVVVGGWDGGTHDLCGVRRSGGVGTEIDDEVTRTLAPDAFPSFLIKCRDYMFIRWWFVLRLC